MSTILVVDDDTAFLDATNTVLAGAGYRVLQALDGERAVRLLDALHESIDLVIVDLALPDINGFELIGRLTRRPNSVKVIATTAIFGEKQLECATALGAHAAIRKPEPTKALPQKQWLGTIRNLIGNP